MILIDSNIFLDVFSDDPQWASWSQRALEEHGKTEVLAINPIIYAEISTQFEDADVLDQMLPDEQFRRLQLPYQAGFVAAKCFKQYRQRGGTRLSPLPDFFVGAHAQVDGMKLLTRDKGRYATYFPSVQVIAPG